MARALSYGLVAVSYFFLSSNLPAQDADLANQAKNILAKNCYPCHGENGVGEGGMSYLLDAEQLTLRQKLVPGEPGKSRLIERIEKKEMPPRSAMHQPNEGEIAILKAWIKAGAPRLRPEVKRDNITPAAMAKWMWSDLRKLPEDEQRSIRYLTITHLHNCGEAEESLETYRQGLSKLVNSLSWATRITPPTAIDPQRTIFRIDLRDYKWTKRTWGQISSQYPYTVLTDAADERNCRNATETDRFHVRADWFAAHATNGVTYNQILQFPLTARELKKVLGVANDEDLTSGRVHRAAFAGSRVTTAARVIERHESHFGAFWTASIFANLEQIAANPLAQPELRFGAGQQAIFHLPNGMIAFATWDSTERLDHAAIALQDVRKPGMPVRSALSCMSCHASGVVSKQDEVLALAKKNAALKDQLAKIELAYPSSNKFEATFAEDNDRYQKASAKTGAKFGITDPIVALAWRHEEDVPLPQVALEFGVPLEQLMKRLVGIKANKDTRMKRKEVVAAYGELAEALGLGKVPARVVAGEAPLVFAEMLLPARGLPSTPVAIAKKVELPNPNTPPSALILPTLPPKLIPNRLQVLTSRDHIVCQVTAFLGDRQPIAIASKDSVVAMETSPGVVTCFDPLTGVKKFVLDGHKSSVSAIEFSPDGRFVATASAESVKLWRATNGLLLHTIPHKGLLSTVKFAVDSKSFATIGDILAVWSVPGGESVPLKHSKGGASWKRVVAVAPDMKTVAALGNGFGLYSLDTGNEVASLAIPAGTGLPTAAVFSPDGRWLATAGAGNGIVLWDLSKRQVKTILRGHRAPVNSLAFSPNSKLLVSGAGKTMEISNALGELKIWEVDIESHWKSLVGHSRAITQVAIGNDGKWVISGSKDGTVRVWSLQHDIPMLQTKAALAPFEGHSASILAASNSADGRYVVTGSEDGAVHVWDAKSGAEIKRLMGLTKRVYSVAIAADGASVYAASFDQKLIQWDLEKGSIVRTTDLPQRAWAGRFAPSGKYLIIAADGVVSQISTLSGRAVRSFQTNSKSTTAIGISATERSVAVSDGNRNVYVWDLDTEKVRLLRGNSKWAEGNKNSIVTLSFSPDGQLLVSGSALTQNASIWDLQTGEEIHRIGEFPGNIMDLLFATDSKSLYVSSGLSAHTAKKTEILVRCSIAQVDAATGNVIQYWDNFPDLPMQMLRAGNQPQLLVVVGNTLMRMSTENGKTITR